MIYNLIAAYLIGGFLTSVGSFILSHVAESPWLSFARGVLWPLLLIMNLSKYGWQALNEVFDD